MADFQTCYNWVLPHEAGNPPDYATHLDNKGMVIAGINSLAYPGPFAKINAAELWARPAVCQQFYTSYFWNQAMGQIASNRIAAYLMDTDVNQGPRTGVELAQEAVNACGGTLVVDGSLGPLTVAAINAMDPVILFPAFQQVREDAYKKIGGPYLTGWLERAALVPPFS